MSIKEKNLINDILVNLPESERLFRANSGQAWAGEIIKRTPDTITIKHPRCFHGMPEGTPDLIGWREITVARPCCGSCSIYDEPECSRWGENHSHNTICSAYTSWSGTKLAVFYAVECKTGRLQLSDAQKKFRNVLTRMGGVFREWRE